MEKDNDMIIRKRVRIMTAVKYFKEEIDLHGHKSTEKELSFLKEATKFHEDLANDEDGDDVMYLIDRLIYFENLFNDFVIKH